MGLEISEKTHINLSIGTMITVMLTVISTAAYCVHRAEDYTGQLRQIGNRLDQMDRDGVDHYEMIEYNDALRNGNTRLELFVPTVPNHHVPARSERKNTFTAVAIPARREEESHQ